MAARVGLGPVFAADCLSTSRRWQVYAGRALLVASVLLAIGLVWLNRYSGARFISFRDFAAAGSAMIRAIMVLELTLALAIVPAVTAGVICQDKMRGGLTLMMVTDLSDVEIVLGRLASRMVTVLGVIACGLPVLAILTAFGGVDPVEIATGTMVIVGVAVMAVCLSLTFSVWATKPHEALTATYAAFGVWLLPLLAWSAMFPGFPVRLNFLHHSNPLWLLTATDWEPKAASPSLRFEFFIGSLVVSAMLAAISIWQIRPVTLRQASRSARSSRSRGAANARWFGRFGMPQVSLDSNPMLWRKSMAARPEAGGGQSGGSTVLSQCSSLFWPSGTRASLRASARSSSRSDCCW